MERASLDFYVASAVWSFASAFGVGLIGGLSLLGGRARPRGAYAFGIFSILWSLQILAINAATLTRDARLGEWLYLASTVLLIVMPYFLVEFALAHAPPRGLAWTRVLALALAGGAALLFIANPGLLFQGVLEYEGYYAPAYGPLYLYLVQAPRFVALGMALWMLHLALSTAATPRVAQRTWILLVGLGLYAAHAASTYAVTYGFYSRAKGGPLTQNDPFWTVLFVGFTLLTAVIAWRHARLRAAAISAPERRMHGVIAGLLGAALAWGALEATLVLTVNDDIQTVGLWRLAGVAIIAYGIARWRIYDLRQRTTRAAARATGAGVALATGAAAYGGATLASATPAVPIVAGVAVLGVAILPSLRMARRLFGVDRPAARPDLETALYGQRIDAYRAALEASLARGSLDEDQEFLAALRERFSISDAEERVLMHYARSSVIVARDRQAFDAYERLRLLGEGGAGRTWLARDRARDRLVVLKEPLPHWQHEPSAREAVLREARIAARVRHPHVVAVEEVVEGKGSPVIVMEYMEGGSLSDLLRARGTLPWRDARSLMLDVLGGVEAIHAAGIVHRDLKPSNILLASDGVAKVADFGIAVNTTGSDRTVVLDPALSQSTIAGTLAYMAPEARAGALPDKGADVYACAAILHECLYAAPPGLRSPVVVRKDLPAALPALLASALAEDPARRPASARAFAEELAKL